ncbi:pirin-like protein isoform X2 [Lolium perenne]|uniref:pirin-like protein isoform X2 n=1 Tax=Lolium perenne TaxID=4522 RepID=UPI003A98F837
MSKRKMPHASGSCLLPQHGAFTQQDFFRKQAHHQNSTLDGGGQRHRALRDAGVKKSPQVWINLASKGKSKPIYQELYRKYIRQASKDGVNIRIIAASEGHQMSENEWQRYEKE